MSTTLCGLSGAAIEFNPSLLGCPAHRDHLAEDATFNNIKLLARRGERGSHVNRCVFVLPFSGYTSARIIQSQGLLGRGPDQHVDHSEKLCRRRRRENSSSAPLVPYHVPPRPCSRSGSRNIPYGHSDHEPVTHRQPKGSAARGAQGQPGSTQHAPACKPQSFAPSVKEPAGQAAGRRARRPQSARPQRRCSGREKARKRAGGE